MHREWNRIVPLGACAAALLLATLAGPTVPARAQGPAPPPDTLLTPVSPQPAPGGAAPAETPPAQGETPVPPPPAVIPAAAAPDTAFAYPLLFGLRTRDEIQRDLDTQARVRSLAQQRMLDARALETRRKYDVDIKKTEIDAAKKRLDLAKKEKRSADIPGLDAARKRLEAQKDYLERLRDCAGAEAEFQEATADYASARDAASQAELKVMGVGDFGSADVRAGASGRNAQARWNDALKARAGAGSSLADREKSLCDRRKSAMDAWLKLNAKG